MLEDCSLGLCLQIKPNEISLYLHYCCRCILQANLWDTAREKLPRRKKPEHISLMNYKAEIGIPQARIVNTLLKNLALRAVQVLSLQDRDFLASRRLMEDFLLRADFSHGYDSIYLSCNSDLLIGSTKSLSAFIDATGVADSKYSSIGDIFPIAPTVDLNRSNIYHARSGTGLISSSFKPHTLLLSMNPEWSILQRHASALMCSYGHCIEMAKSRDATSNLQANPISIQTIHTDGQMFGFTGFQLNTLETDYKKDGVIRNQAWVDSDRLYHKQEPDRASLRATKYHSYNSHVVHKILGMLSRQ